MRLLKRGIFALVLLFTAQNLSAQFFDEHTESNTKAGLRLGIGGSQLYGTVLQNERTGRVFSGGFYVRNKLSSKFNIQSEALISYRGGRYNHPDTGVNNLYDKIVLLYVDIPVYLMFNPKGDQKHNIMIGPQFSYLLRSSIFASNPTDGVKPPRPMYTDLPLKNIDFMASVAYLYSMENIGFMINVRYGLTNINDFFDLSKAESLDATPPVVLPAQNPTGTLRNFVIDLSVSF